ncbi:hypothetical protein RN001_000189 [Aquatica leii]|uniref:Uncharacterized protein n=1 Tax=Aquatica leii TaxID=1421715 RepID=A0AAN7SQH0_9COLE|nr:hypothetical protein RN001_000189 [Aquatica leii]
MTDDISKIYLDEEQNLQFNDFYLEEILAETNSVESTPTFKYQAASLLEYALKKEKLLLEVRKSIDTGTVIDLIAFGLPNYVADKINIVTLQGTEDLYNELGKLEHFVGKNKYDKKDNIYSDNRSIKIEKENHAKFVSAKKEGYLTMQRKIAGLKRKIEKQF